MYYLLASGNGKFMKGGFILSGTALVVGFILLHLGLELSDTWRNQDKTMATMFIIFGIAMFAAACINAVRTMMNFRTNISVYEDVVKGNGQTGQFSAPQEFIVPFNEIRNVDVLKNVAVVVHTQYAKYTCYMKNGNEVRDKIMELVNAQKI